MSERWDAPSRSRRTSRLAGSGERRTDRNRRVGGGYAQRVINEISREQREYEQSPAGLAAAAEAHQQVKVREQERVLQTQDWAQVHIADLAVKLAASYGREEPNDEDKEAASIALGAAFNAVQEPAYQEMPKPGWKL